jgi:ubiquinone/menaquinone biosynthesis C-methylase UbiE
MNKELFKKNIIEIEDNLMEVEGLHIGEYDVQAVQYDKLISNSLYNRIMWGNTPKDYSDFCKKGLESSNNGIITDIGCGTLSFTFKSYVEYNRKDLFLCDLSYEMLKIGKNRIQDTGKDLSNIKLLRSNAIDMPFKENTIETVLNFGLFHIFNNPSELIREIVRILKPKGQLFLTSLCTDRKLSAKYLNLLHKKGHVAKPLKSIEIKDIIEENGIKITEFRTKGGMTYISGIKTPTHSRVS